MKFPGKLLKLLLAAACAGTFTMASGAATAQVYYPGGYSPPGYYPQPPAYYPPPVYYPQQPPVYYTPAPRASRGVAEQCATQFGTCQIGPTRPGRGCNCFFPGSGKIPGVAVR